MHREVLCRTLPQGGSQVTVDLDDHDLPDQGEHPVGQHPEAGADLQHPVAGLEFSGGYNLVDDLPVAEKILAETFFGTMIHGLVILKKGRAKRQGGHA
jgi:hypothetical protein